MADIHTLTPVDPEPTPTAKRGSGLLGWIATVLIGIGAAAIVVWSGLSFNVVATDSMVPTFDPTDMVVSVDPKLKQPVVGEVVIFTAEFLDTPIPPHVHRIVGVEPDGNFITQGDNASQPDPWRVDPANVQGVVVGSVPTALVRNPVVLGGALFVFLAILLWPRKSNDDDEGEHAAKDATGSGSDDGSDHEKDDAPVIPPTSGRDQTLSIIKETRDPAP